MKRTVMASLLAATVLIPAAAVAQGVPGGIEKGSREGERAAGPIGGIVGGAIGGVVGGVNGVLGIDIFKSNGAYDDEMRRLYFRVFREHPWLVVRSFLIGKPLDQLTAFRVTPELWRRHNYVDPMILAVAATLLALALGAALPTRRSGRGKDEREQARLLRDAARRDELARRYGIKGVEMEGSGLAVGASLRGVPWFVVRGVSDYCDKLKDDTWREYASLTSAAFVAVLLRHCRPLAVHLSQTLQ